MTLGLRRVGHTRPVGSEWRMRLHSWRQEEPPALFDHVFEEPEELKRGFVVVGVEETRDPTVYRLVLERIGWGRFCAALIGGANVWSFVRDR